MKINNLQVIKEKRRDLRLNASMPERILWKWIRNNQLGYKFRWQHSIGKYIVDFYCAPLKLVVEIDGKIHGEETVAEHDAIRTAYLQTFGLIIKRYAAQQVNNDLAWVLGDLRTACDALGSSKDGNLTHPDAAASG